MKRYVVALSLSLLACQQRPAQEDPCDELSQYAPSGIKLADDEQRCREILAFASRTKELYGLEFKDWFDRVFSQRSKFILATIDALTTNSSMPASLSYYPAAIPCGGLVIADAEWASSPLGPIVSPKPEKIYVSLSFETTGNQATIRVRQDFDCDNSSAITTMTGRFTRGVPALNGGWVPSANTPAELDE